MESVRLEDQSEQQSDALPPPLQQDRAGEVRGLPPFGRETLQSEAGQHETDPGQEQNQSVGTERRYQEEQGRR